MCGGAATFPFSETDQQMPSPLLTEGRGTAVSSEAWAKLRVWASVAGRGRLLLSGSVAHASLETAVLVVIQDWL